MRIPVHERLLMIHKVKTPLVDLPPSPGLPQDVTSLSGRECFSFPLFIAKNILVKSLILVRAVQESRYSICGSSHARGGRMIACISPLYKECKGYFYISLIQPFPPSTSFHTLHTCQNLACFLCVLPLALAAISIRTPLAP